MDSSALAVSLSVSEGRIFQNNLATIFLYLLRSACESGESHFVLLLKQGLTM